jgi:hypothetical protein
VQQENAARDKHIHMSRLLSRALVLLALTLTLPASSVLAADDISKWEEGGKFLDTIVVSQEKCDGKNYLKATINTTASPAKVWNSILEEPNYDTHLLWKKIVSKQESRTVLEEEFEGVPLVGHTKALVQADETPYSSLTYTLLKSNHFKHLDATWTLKKCPRTNNTVVELRACVETKVFCPQIVLNGIIASRLKRRLCFVKNFSERTADNELAYQQAAESK